MKSDKFLVITTISDKLQINQVCNLLEEAEIPMMLEHVEIVRGPIAANAVRVLVPAQNTNLALRLIEASQSGGVMQPSASFSSNDAARVLN